MSANSGNKIFLFLAFLFLFCETEMFAQGVPQTRIRAIFVNGVPVAPSERDDLAIRSDDVVEFFFGCDFPDQTTEEDKWVYRLEFRGSEDEVSSERLQQPYRLYKGLSERTYSLSVQAFFPRTKQEAMPERFSFRVSNQASQEQEEKRRAEQQRLKEAQKKVQVENLRSNNTKENFVQKNPSERKNSPADTITTNKKSFLFSEWGIIMGISILALAGLFFAVTFWKKKGDEEVAPEPAVEKNIPAGGSVSRDMYEKIIVENSALRAEIAALRGQIKTAQSRSDELRKQNSEIQDKFERMSSKKQELEDLQNQKDELFAVIIHDIKNPASLIKSLVELLRSYDLTAQDQQEIIEDIVETTTKIVSLSQEVSRIMAIESGEMHLEVNAFPIREVIKDVFRRNNIAAQRKDIHFSMDVPDNLPNVAMDPQKIEEVLDNLISNAIKFTQNTGSVRIRAFEDGNSVTVEISDTGLGLSEEDLKKAFTRGSKLSAQPTGGESSSGLGLWIVKKIIEAHKGGRVWVKSALGKGSTFAFQLPIATKYAADE